MSKTSIAVQVIERDEKDVARVRRATWDDDGRILHREFLLPTGNWAIMDPGPELPYGVELEVQLYPRSW